MMNPKLKQLWIDALESGDYQQGQGRLWRRAKNEYCCLGVLGRILEEQSHMLRGVVEYKDEYLTYNEGDTSHAELAILPDVLASEVGLTWGQQKWLAKMNDNGASFFQIAGYIRENL